MRRPIPVLGCHAIENNNNNNNYYFIILCKIFPVLRNIDLALSDDLLYVTYNMEFSLGGLNFPGNPDHPAPHTARMTEGLFHT
jgi:hypothetical protein